MGRVLKPHPTLTGVMVVSATRGRVALIDVVGLTKAEKIAADLRTCLHGRFAVQR